MKKILKLKAVLHEDHQISCRAAFRGANAAETGAALFQCSRAHFSRYGSTEAIHL